MRFIYVKDIIFKEGIFHSLAAFRHFFIYIEVILVHVYAVPSFT